MNLTTLLKFLPAIGPITAAIPDVKKLYDEAVATLHPSDQATATEAYHDLMAQNDEGHARLQEKLAEAAKR